MRIRVRFAIRSSAFMVVLAMVVSPALSGGVLSHTAEAATIRSITFPVLGTTRFSDDFGDPRSGGRTHEGNDIFGFKGQPLIAAVDGVVRFVPYPQPSYGYAVTITDSDGYRYSYLHINNDTPGTDDGRGGGRNAYAPGMESGAPVVRGQLIGYLGDSGNAESTSPHLHFEIRTPDGDPINPYQSLRQASRVGRLTPRPAVRGEVIPYGTFRGGASVAVGELDGNPFSSEFVVGAGPGGGPHVITYNADLSKRGQLFPLARSFRGGVDVALGDIEGDGIDEVIIGAGAGGPPTVKIVKEDGTVLHEFLAYGATIKTGVRVAAADLTGDGRVEIVTGPGKGGGPHVRVFNPDGTRVSQFFAYGTRFRGGIDVSATAATEYTPAAIVTSAGPGGGPHIRVFTLAGEVISQYFARETSFRGGMRVSVGEADGSTPGPEIYSVEMGGANGEVQVAALLGGSVSEKVRSPYEEWWLGGFDIGAGQDSVKVSTAASGREAAVRTAIPSSGFFDFRSPPEFSRVIGD